ncbi:MAG: hypothetical protein K4445_12460 [Deltaproteobacteria bacterium]|jgi:exopolyphosphatase/guanosine-5'-triphosphate,3'-diphosphate pyrophosphatase|nr:hypothetical protein [Syntrophaceae bacterium]
MHYGKHQPSLAAGRPVFYPLIPILLLAVWIGGCATWIGSERAACIESRAAFDIGSATLKMKAAEVDRCANIPLNPLLRKDVKVAFSENTPNRSFSPEIQRLGIAELQKLKSDAEARGVSKFAGVATAAFREAINAPAFLAEVKRQTGVDIRLISQDEEALLGYKAVRAAMPAGPVVTWDIGGNSMQMVYQDRSGRYRLYRGRTASVTFKRLVLEDILHKEACRSSSPNPIGAKNLARALAAARSAAGDVPAAIQNALKQSDTNVIGIGGVHNASLRHQLQAEDAYTRDELAAALQKRIDWSDSQIGGAYADTDVTNLILVLGFMQALEIDRVILKDINLTDGVLIEPSFWQ